MKEEHAASSLWTTVKAEPVEYEHHVFSSGGASSSSSRDPLAAAMDLWGIKPGVSTSIKLEPKEEPVVKKEEETSKEVTSIASARLLHFACMLACLR